jgi:hypothetical protein
MQRGRTPSGLGLLLALAIFFCVGTASGLSVAAIYGRPISGAIITGAIVGAVVTWAVFAVAFRIYRRQVRRWPLQPPGSNRCGA